ncbi:GNAT family N-acetyltransferase [Zongyangia hominis]|uniref:GNAT family N-acetyltransferase n=1 Tax=Zongyangia hominis TaxID=2763677 RepID=A0A926ICK6_9FIRM|nr:GNAT family N-acetyltransferase [Zongyangia hominis]MBC8571322.1 GNAT family N-acetyltransferase [Zongyangia hominis]
MQLHTSRLRIQPLTMEEFRLLLEGTAQVEAALGLSPAGRELDPHTKEAMKALYAEAVRNEDNYQWYTNWMIIRNVDNVAVGSACFMGRPDRDGSVELGYGLEESYWGQGYMTEAARALCDWALSQPGVRRVTAETERGNLASQRVLQNCGMQLYRATEEGLFWKREKEASV